MTIRTWSSHDNRPREGCDPLEVTLAQLNESPATLPPDKLRQSVEDAFSQAMYAEVENMNAAMKQKVGPLCFGWKTAFRSSQEAMWQNRIALAGILLMVREAVDRLSAEEKEDLVWRAFMLLRAPRIDADGMQRYVDNAKRRREERERGAQDKTSG